MRQRVIFIAIFMLFTATESRGETSPKNGVKFFLPASLAEDADVIGAWVDVRIDEFLAQCGKWYPAKACTKVLRSRTVYIVDDYTFYCRPSPTRLCAGLSSGKNITVSLYNQIDASSYEECEASDIVRDRQGMYLLSRRTKYWLQHRDELFCENPNSILPALVHELCHAFGPKVGHVAGYEDCQPVN